MLTVHEAPESDRHATATKLTGVGRFEVLRVVVEPLRLLVFVDQAVAPNTKGDPPPWVEVTAAEALALGMVPLLARRPAALTRWQFHAATSA